MSTQPERQSTKSPIRIQRQRTRGWRMPENTVYVGRPTRFGNPFRPLFYSDPQRVLEAVIRYRAWLSGDLEAPHSAQSRPHPDWIAGLRGKNLACWCRLDQSCHADVLLELANAKAEGK